eukprot:CAMPEP_0197186488 /NCGR_PEP_ID=MMETSP1423-20130617/14049_1 /TAXON_ID=476441 /ORGANISM="Pseudo-nitzschia heimii, Strain UNC1101" /LENGTH=54 /DNA_ID=CAMNT_0042637827 /DNA_START=65 /DNA_END=226 /DNA_ORIENTATION=-
MSEDDEDVIALAIKRLDKAIHKLLKRRDDNNTNGNSRRCIRRLVDHARHILKEL